MRSLVAAISCDIDLVGVSLLQLLQFAIPFLNKRVKIHSLVLPITYYIITIILKLVRDVIIN